MLHGFTLTGRLNWDVYLDPLGAHYLLVVPDLRARALRQPPGIVRDERSPVRARYLAVVRAASNRSATFFGYSMGAAVVLNLALTCADLVAGAAIAAGSLTIPDPSAQRCAT